MNKFFKKQNSCSKKLMQPIKLKADTGQAMMAVVVIFLFISIIIGANASVIALAEVKQEKVLLNSKKSYFLTEAGIEDAVYRIKNGKNISVSETIITAEGQVDTSISDVLGNKEIVASADINGNIRKVETFLSSTFGFDFFYGAQVGEGGIEMNENSRVEGADGAAGNIYSNGPIVGEQGAIITGDATVATGVEEDNGASSLVCNEDQIVGQSDPEIDFAQSFKPSDSKPLAKVSLYIKKVGSPGDRKILLVADDNGSPDTSKLSEGKLFSSLVGTDYAWIDVVFSNPANLTANQTYWIVLDAKQDQNKYWVWCKDKNNGFGNGVAKYSEDWDNDPWINVAGDLNFKTHLGAGISFLDTVTVNGTARANTIKDSAIGGDAYYQSIANSTVGGNSYPGSSDPPLLNMPISQANIDQWKIDASAGGDNNSECGGDSPCDHTVSENEDLGPIKITGDLLMTNPNKILTVDGTIYVQGNIDISNGSTIQCSTSYGADSCVVFSDGWIHIKNNGAFSGSGQSGSYIMLLTTLACDGSSSSPPCDESHHNGAIDVHNQATGAIFYASDGLIHLHNGVNVTEVIAYKLELDNNAVITYETGVANSNFSSGPGGSWNLASWKEVE
jgi:hypothetical protein